MAGIGWEKRAYGAVWQRGRGPTQRAPHRSKSLTASPVEITEVWSGAYLAEGDVVRPPDLGGAPSISPD